MPKKRNVQNIDLSPVLHIYCEGEKTEPIYIKNYINKKFPGDRRKRVIVEPTRKNTPVQLVDVAVNHKQSNDCPDHDVFWVVYDRESVTKYPEKLHAAAWKKAAKHGVNIAISNVCFELWIYLHFQSNTATFSSYDNFTSHSNFKKHLSNFGIDNYEKGSTLLVKNLTDEKIEYARNQAAAMNASTSCCAPIGKTLPYQLNPYTNVHELLGAIDSFK